MNKTDTKLWLLNSTAFLQRSRKTILAILNYKNFQIKYTEKWSHKDRVVFFPNNDLMLYLIVYMKDIRISGKLIKLIILFRSLEMMIYQFIQPVHILTRRQNLTISY